MAPKPISRRRAGLLLTLTEVGIRLFGFRRMQRLLIRRAERQPIHEPNPERAQQVADTVDSARAHSSPYPAQCLTRSLVLQYYLRRIGQEPVLRLGVRQTPGRFAAHAWVECCGTELNEAEPAGQIYSPFDWTNQNVPEAES